METKPDKLQGDFQSPELQIAWAKIVARAAVDERFRSRLEADSAVVFEEYGVKLDRRVDLNKDLSLSLSTIRVRLMTSAGSRVGAAMV